MCKNDSEEAAMLWSKGILRFFKKRRLSVRYSMLAAILLLMSITISFGDEDTGSLTVINQTEKFLHIIVDGDPYLYIAPGNRVTHEAEGEYEFSVTAFYSPGQGIAARIDRELRVPYSRTGGCDYSLAGGCECNPVESEYGSGTWKITADTMLVSPSPTSVQEGATP
jgi:hypothetical protein